MSVNGFKVNGNTVRYDYRYLDNLPDLEGATAEDYNSTKTYNIGDYVWYNGVLYRCISDVTTAETWTAAHWTAAVLGNDVGDLKNAVDTLNKGGLVLKDEVIGRDIRDWLDDHPEATTTVQDGSLTEVKFTTDLRHKLLTGYVYSESDFENDWDVYILCNNITITKPITAFDLDKTIDLNGKTITLDSNYQGNYIFKGVSGSGPTTFEHRQAIYGGTIDCNNVDCCVIWVDYSITNTTISNLVINNNIRGLFNYADSINSKGAQVALDNIVISHTKTHTDNYIGLDIQFGDSTIKNVWVQFFKYGVRNVYGTDNLFVNIHPWGYPKDGNYSDSSQMAIGFIIFGAYNRFYSCIADTFEPISATEDASYTNGGIGFYVRTNQTVLDGCYALTHSASNNNKHIYYYFDDTNPETGARNYLSNNVMNDCSVSLSQGQIVKGTGLYITSGKEYTLIYNNCILKNREFETKIANEALMPIKSVYETLTSKGYYIYTDSANRTMHWIKDDINNQYMSLIVPYVNPKFRDEATMRTALYNSPLYGKIYPIQLFATDSGDLYAYQSETGKFAKITIGNWG